MKLNQITGGMADGHDTKEFDQKELEMGIKIEMEHTNDKKLATEIATDHLKENPKYYTKLKKAKL